MTDDGIVQFPLGNGLDQAGPSLVYRPWSTRTLKVQVTTDVDMLALRIRPGRIRPEEAEVGIFRSYADEGDAFVISWGGGHEEGPCIRAEDFLMAFERPAPLPAGETSNLYFNLTHRGPEMPAKATVTLEAYDPKSGRVAASLAVSLERPPGMPADGELMRLKPTGTGDWQLSSGKYLPSYDSRWWPSPEVKYESSDAPPLAIIKVDNRLEVRWGSDNQVIATITDNTKPSVLLDPESMDVELFAFDQWSVALRVWFFWLDKRIGGGFFVGRHEVPDAERFDIIIRRSDGLSLLAATDLHWREFWSEVAERPLRAAIGVGKEDKATVLKDMMGNIWSKLAKREKERENYVNNPMDDYVLRLAELMAKETVRAKGTEAHVPMLFGVEQRRPDRMTSTDVRKG
jgi:hypothetical protein